MSLRERYITEAGYPTDEALEKLRKWPADDVNGALDFMAALWWPDGVHGVSRELCSGEGPVVYADEDDRFLRLATGGWSGNESLISAFHGADADGKFKIEAFMRGAQWCLSARGGLHIYQYAPNG